MLRAAVQPEHHRAARDRAAALRHHVRRRPQRGHALSSQSQVSIQWCSTNERRVLAAADLDGGGGHGDRGVDVRPGHREEDGGEGGDGEPRHQAAVRLAGHLRAAANQRPVLRCVAPPMRGEYHLAAVRAGGGHQADQQRVEEGGDTLRGQRAPEREGPATTNQVSVFRA